MTRRWLLVGGRRWMFHDRLEQIRAKHKGLFSSHEPLDDAEVARWNDALRDAEQDGIAPQDILQYGALFARVAEGYSLHLRVGSILVQLEDLIARRGADRATVVEILISAGELDRRLARLDRARERLAGAMESTRLVEPPVCHRQRCRALYEIAFIDRMVGDATGAIGSLERSDEEGRLGGDVIGAIIARTLRAAILTEEGRVSESVRSLTAEREMLLGLLESGEIEAGRRPVANRWAGNARIHLAQAMLAAGDAVAADALLQEYREKHGGTSVEGQSTFLSTKARVLLSMGKYGDARGFAVESMRALRSLPEALDLEGAAALLALGGVLYLAPDDERSEAQARALFEEARRLKTTLRNAEGQSWAAVGLALFAQRRGDEAGARDIIAEGKERCARCSRPSRMVLDMLLRAPRTDRDPGEDFEILAGLAGALPEWLKDVSEAPAYRA